MGAVLTVFTDLEGDHHDTPNWHPEHRGRLEAALTGVRRAGLLEAAEWRIPEPAPLASIIAVHDPVYVSQLDDLCAQGGGEVDGDTIVSGGSFVTARKAAGAVLQGVEALRSGTTDLVFAAGRPPGHHAVRDRAMGFCLFNNAAIGAAELSAAGERVAIVDWDVHHGNGTQDIFYDDPNVLYISTHESPLYPGTGQLRQQGGDEAFGANLNLPFPAGTAGDTFRAGFDEVVIPAIERFAPDWLFISAGYDAHRNDPLAGLRLTAADYADLARRLQPLVAKQRLLVVLEGGYDLDALSNSVGATLSTLVGGAFRPETASSGEIGMPTVVAAKQLWEF